MSVERIVNRAIDPELFDRLCRAIEWIREQHGITGYENVAPVMKQLYNVSISDLTQLNNGVNAHFVRFDSEQDYSWFVLRWS